jgi:hypothetical protein
MRSIRMMPSYAMSALTLIAAGCGPDPQVTTSNPTRDVPEVTTDVGLNERLIRLEKAVDALRLVVLDADSSTRADESRAESARREPEVREVRPSSSLEDVLIRLESLETSIQVLGRALNARTRSGPEVVPKDINALRTLLWDISRDPDRGRRAHFAWSPRDFNLYYGCPDVSTGNTWHYRLNADENGLMVLFREGLFDSFRVLPAQSTVWSER